MKDTPPFALPARVPPVAPDLLGSAIFLFSEYLNQQAEERIPEAADADKDEDDPPGIDTRAVLDLFAENLGTGVPETLALYLRVTALFRMLAASPSLARLALQEPGDPASALSETALLAAARLDLQVVRRAGDGAADFDPRAFREALRDA